MTVACTKWKIILANTVIRGGALCDKNLQQEVINYCRKDFNFTLNLNEKLYLPIFAERIGPKYFQNPRMVLNDLWIDDEIYEKKLPVLFLYKYMPK